MIPYLIIDTGPIVAYLDPKDQYHNWVEEKLQLAGKGFLTCESVLSEAAFLLSKSKLALSVVVDFVNLAPVDFPFQYPKHRIEIRTLIAKYADVPMSFADACLVCISNLYPDAPILTLDSDFLVYRRNRNEPLPVIIPEARKR